MHVTIAEAEYNQGTQRLEIALRISAIDMDKIMEDYKEVNSVTGEAVDEFITIKLSKNFLVRYKDEAPSELLWIGKELSHKYVWLYFEFLLPKGFENLAMSNRLFFSEEKNQANTITVKFAEQHISIVCTAQKPWHEIQF